jgi:hypothetical protein
MVNFLNIDNELLRYIGIIALAIFLLFVISKILALNDRLLQGLMGNKEGFTDKGLDRSKVDHDKQMLDLKETHKKYLRRLRLPEDRAKIMDELDEYLDNVKLEEVLLLNWMMIEQKKTDDEKNQKWLIEAANQLNSYKYIREAVNRVEL